MMDRETKIRERAHRLWQEAGSPDGQEHAHWLQAEHEIDHGTTDGGGIEPDERPNLDAMREAARQRSDSYVVEADLEDADQREAAAGTREQP
ncbi:DUF2934 domain-containing protein [Pararhizobium sp. O133]|uniref:DUF2934 domain-containing protein n=1 Tax=Pararhizobium sp. O133 TaxID=3449278 RepID=UPI003F6878B3